MTSHRSKREKLWESEGLQLWFWLWVLVRSLMHLFETFTIFKLSIVHRNRRSMTGSKGKRVLFCNIFELGCDFVPPGVSLSVSQFSCLWWRYSQKCEWTLQVSSGCQSLRLGFSEVWQLSDEESRSRLGGVAAPFSHNTESYLLCADLRRSSHRPSLFHRWV